MPFHLFVVSQDLNYFAHLHPGEQTDGRFTIETMVPKAGAYIIYCDVFPVGGMPQVAHLNLITAGFKADLSLRGSSSSPTRFLPKPLPECALS